MGERTEGGRRARRAKKERKRREKKARRAVVCTLLSLCVHTCVCVRVCVHTHTHTHTHTHSGRAAACKTAGQATYDDGVVDAVAVLEAVVVVQPARARLFHKGPVAGPFLRVAHTRRCGGEREKQKGKKKRGGGERAQRGVEGETAQANCTSHTAPPTRRARRPRLAAPDGRLQAKTTACGGGSPLCIRLWLRIDKVVSPAACRRLYAASSFMTSGAHRSALGSGGEEEGQG